MAVVNVTVAQYLAQRPFDPVDDVTIVDTAANIAAGLSGLSPTEIALLGSSNVDAIDVSDDLLAIDVAQMEALGAANVKLTPTDTITLRDTSAVLDGGTPAEVAALAGIGIDIIDSVDDQLTYSAAMFQALGSVGLTAGDAITLKDTGANIAALTSADIAAMAAKGVDLLDANDGATSLGVASFNALGAMTFAADDFVTLSDHGSAFGSLTTGQIGSLAGKGIDALDATNGLLTLSSAQYAALGVPLVAGDVLKINGTIAADVIVGTSGSDILKGDRGNDVLSGALGNDNIFGGLGKDNLTGGEGRDAFAFDTKLSKKTNFDKITDYNLKDDSVYLDNAIFKKLGKGSEANPTKLKKAFFTVGTKAKDSNDYLIYDKKKGVLYYDVDGSGLKAQVEITSLKKNLKMTYQEFFVI